MVWFSCKLKNAVYLASKHHQNSADCFDVRCTHQHSVHAKNRQKVKYHPIRGQLPCCRERRPPTKNKPILAEGFWWRLYSPPLWILIYMLYIFTTIITKCTIIICIPFTSCTIVQSVSKQCNIQKTKIKENIIIIFLSIYYHINPNAGSLHVDTLILWRILKGLRRLGLRSDYFSIHCFLPYSIWVPRSRNTIN